MFGSDFTTLSMLLGILDASLWGNLLTGKDTIRE